MESFFLENTEVILPPFPNWEKSFISGPNSPLFKIEHRVQKIKSNLLLTKVDFTPKAEGPPGHVHGGASAALIDETMGILVWHHQYACVTQKLSLEYLVALPIDQTAYLITEITAIKEKVIQVSCTIYDEKKVPHVSSHGTFHRLTASQLQKFKS